MIYSQATMQTAFNAPSNKNLFRDIITVGDAIESETNEKEIAMFEENAPDYEAQKKEFYMTHQGDNFEDSNF